MEKIVRLSDEQLKRFRRVLVESGYCSSMQKAKKLTDSAPKCHRVFVDAIDLIEEYIEEYNYDSIEDIADLYIVDDEELYKNSNCGADLLANCTHKIESFIPVDDTPKLPNQPHKKKARGKQKRPTMKHYKVRLPLDVLDQLKELDGTVSGHIRKAVNLYLTQGCNL